MTRTQILYAWKELAPTDDESTIDAILSIAAQITGVGREYWRDTPLRDTDNEIRKALVAWASKPENLPHDVAIVNGIPYRMKDDEARTSRGVVSRIADDWKSFPLDRYDWQPGQRERIEKWRASQPKPLADDEVFEQIVRKLQNVTSNPFTGEVRVFAGGLGYQIAVETGMLRGQSLTNARNYAKKHLKLAPDEYLCEESWTVKKRVRRTIPNAGIYVDAYGTKWRNHRTEIFPGEE